MGQNELCWAPWLRELSVTLFNCSKCSCSSDAQEHASILWLAIPQLSQYRHRLDWPACQLLNTIITSHKFYTCLAFPDTKPSIFCSSQVITYGIFLACPKLAPVIKHCRSLSIFYRKSLWPTELLTAFKWLFNWSSCLADRPETSSLIWVDQDR